MLYNSIEIDGRPRATEGTGGPVIYRQVTPAYFAVLGIPILRGRSFEEGDRAAGNAIILSDTLARRMFPGGSALGQRLRPGRVGPWLTVVGVAGDVKNRGLAQRDDPEYYTVRAHRQEAVGRAAVAVLRTPLDPAAMAGAVRAEIGEMDRTLPVKLDTLEQRVGAMAERPRFNALLLAVFAAMAVLLAAIGLYGVATFLVAQRVREIGMRVALGATPGSIVRLVLGQSARWTAAGTVVGLAGSMAAMRWLEAMLFQVSARDPWTYAAPALLLFGVSLGAVWAPSLRAARVDPMDALRQE